MNMEYSAGKSTCNLCEKKFTQRGMIKHITSCIAKKMYNQHGIPTLYIVVQAPFNHDYFFHLLLSPTTTLKDLDTFLRNQWLECCGHMSSFSLKKRGQEISMSGKVNEILSAGRTLVY